MMMRLLNGEPFRSVYYNHSQEHENRTRFFFDRYTKWGKNQTVFSARILKLKEMDEGVIDDFARKFKFLKGLENLAIIRVPSHAKMSQMGWSYWQS